MNNLSSELHRVIDDRLPLGLAVLEIVSKAKGDLRLLYLNRQAAVESKQEMQAMVGQLLRETQPEDFVGEREPPHVEAARRVATTGRSETLEIDRGSRGQLEVHIVSLGGDRVSMVYQNISEKKLAREALETSERRFRQLADAMPQIVWTAAASGRIEYYNHRWFDYTGCSAIEQEIGTVHPDDAPLHRQRWAESVAAGVLFEMRYRLRRYDNQYRWHLGRAVPVYGDGGQLSQWFGTSTDIDDEVRTAALHRARELAMSEERFRQLVDAVHDYAIVMLNPTGHVASWNAGAKRISGFDAEHVLGQHFSMFYDPEEVRQGKPDALLKTTLEQGRAVDEAWRIRQDGSRFMASVVMTAVRDEAGCIVGLAKVTRDITERQKAEQALRLANQELETFSDSVAHDLRAPLRAMHGFAHLLVASHGGKLDAEGQDWLHEIQSNAKKMSELIDALLSLARLTRSKLNRESVDMSALAEAVANELAAAEPTRSVKIRVQPQMQTQADPSLAYDVMANLIGNAFKFTAQVAQPFVEVGCNKVEQELVFFVRDNGAGFDMAYASKLFSPFQRLHTASEYPGTGIGLATVARIVHRHGGRSWAEGKVGAGATFFFTLPRD